MRIELIKDDKSTKRLKNAFLTHKCTNYTLYLSSRLSNISIFHFILYIYIYIIVPYFHLFVVCISLFELISTQFSIDDKI